MFEWLNNAYNNVWAWFKNSGTILLARLTAVIGFFIAVAASFDWSLLFTMFGDPAGFSSMQALWLGVGLFVKGVVDEIVRRSNTKEVDATLIPKSTELVATKGIKKPGSLKKVKTT